jgi:uncharacterized protein
MRIKAMEKLREAIELHPEGLTIRFEVSPGSGHLQVPSGYNPWRRSLEARLTEAPERGKANRQLVNEVSSLLGLPSGMVEVLKGHKNSRKVLLVRGISMEDALNKLSLSLSVAR